MVNFHYILNIVRTSFGVIHYILSLCPSILFDQAITWKIYKIRAFRVAEHHELKIKGRSRIKKFSLIIKWNIFEFQSTQVFNKRKVVDTRNLWPNGIIPWAFNQAERKFSKLIFKLCWSASETLINPNSRWALWSNKSLQS